MRRVRLFHFDIPTRGNYGDRVLFPYVRNVFESFGGGEAYEFVGTAPLRPEVTHDLVARINRRADAVVIGGGGLFLQDTNPNRNSGWQWNIAKETLAALDVPLIVFAVGDNRFPGQPAFDDLFIEHVAQTLDQSVFFGLRNTGSIRTIGDLLPEQRSRIGYQPCPTALANRLHPDLGRSVTEEKVLAVQMLVAARQSAAGFSAEQIHRDVIDVVGRLHADGWTILNTPFHRGDRTFARQLSESGHVDRDVPLNVMELPWRAGVELFSEVGMVLGGRGHAQLVPFGVGALPISVHLHDKFRYFAEDIDRPEWVVDPRRDDFADALHEEIRSTWAGRTEHREHLRRVQDRMYETTLDNLAGIHQALTATSPSSSMFYPAPLPFTARERRLESARFDAHVLAEERRMELDRVTKLAETEASAAQDAVDTLTAQRHRLAESAARTEQVLDSTRTELTGVSRRLATATDEAAAVRAELTALRTRPVRADAHQLARRLARGVRRRLRPAGG